MGMQHKKTKKADAKLDEKNIPIKKHNHIVKRHGHHEQYDSKKVYASVYHAALSTGLHMTRDTAERIARDTTKAVNAWIAKRENVSSQDIFQFVSEYLHQHDKHTQYMYATIRDIS